VAERESTSNSYQYDLRPSFEAGINEYMVLIPYDGDSSREVFVQGTLRNSDDTLLIDNRSVNSGDWRSFSVSAGDTRRVRVEVEDSDRNASNSYYVNIVAAPRNPGTDANLSSLSLRSGSSGSNTISLSPNFSASTTSYTANVPNDVDTIRVFAEGNRASAILVDGVPISGGSATVQLTSSSKDIRITVYAEDCKTSRTYTVAISRGAALS
jgi:hypothetical protein